MSNPVSFVALERDYPAYVLSVPPAVLSLIKATYLIRSKPIQICIGNLAEKLSKFDLTLKFQCNVSSCQGFKCKWQRPKDFSQVNIANFYNDHPDIESESSEYEEAEAEESEADEYEEAEASDPENRKRRRIVKTSNVSLSLIDEESKRFSDRFQSCVRFLERNVEYDIKALKKKYKYEVILKVPLKFPWRKNRSTPCYSCKNSVNAEYICLGYLSYRFKTHGIDEPYDPRRKTSGEIKRRLRCGKICTECTASHLSIKSELYEKSSCLVCRAFRNCDNSQVCSNCNPSSALDELYHGIKVIASVIVDVSMFSLSRGAGYISLVLQTDDPVTNNTTISYFVISTSDQHTSNTVPDPLFVTSDHKIFNLILSDHADPIYNSHQQTDIVRSFIILAVRRWGVFPKLNSWRFFSQKKKHDDDKELLFEHPPQAEVVDDDEEVLDWEYDCDVESHRVFTPRNKDTIEGVHQSTVFGPSWPTALG